MTATIPARITLQIRDGVPNELVAFDLPVGETVPIATDDPDYAEGARFNHRTNILDIYSALAEAQRNIVEQVRAMGAGDSTEEWFRKLADWVLEA